jgi:demethylmenaquinone methyltransferase/2-methoxy-6-polyprenyl-1,4-benzoquinol methylase
VAPSTAAIELYYAHPDRRPGSARALFNRAAKHYDLVNQIFSLGSGAWYRRRCLRQAGIAPGMTVVDIAVGTGLLAREAHRLMQGRGVLLGIDLSESMLAVARRTLDIPLVQGAAEALPFAANSADVVMMGYALRHVSSIDQTLREAWRVLRPGGRLVLLEISPPTSRAVGLTTGLIVGGVLPIISGIFARDRQARRLMAYHWRTIAAYAPVGAVLHTVRQCGFAEECCTSEFDLFRFFSAHKPLR